jgi:putative phosphoesterase
MEDKMKIGIISDIHVDINLNFDIRRGLCKVIESNGVDCLIIAGDISNTYKISLEFIDYIRKNTGVKVYFVPGNHDLWDERKEYNDTNIIYSMYKENESCLCDNPRQINEDWVIIGDTGWYDYSFGESKYNLMDYEKMEAFNRTWQDSIFIHWGKSNREVHKAFLDKLETQIRKQADKKKILVTHMLSRKEFSVPSGDELWGYFNAFLGSTEYGELFEKYKVEYVVMGHVHYRLEKSIKGTKYICSCLSYSNQWVNASSSFEEINKTMKIIEI